MTPPTETTVDVRSIAPRERHAQIFETFRGLAAGHTMQLVNDHDPRPLHQQFQAEMPGEFEWQYIEQGPDTWRVRISRRQAAGSTCCGGCCG